MILLFNSKYFWCVFSTGEEVCLAAAAHTFEPNRGDTQIAQVGSLKQYLHRALSAEALSPGCKYRLRENRPFEQN